MVVDHLVLLLSHVESRLEGFNSLLRGDRRYLRRSRLFSALVT